MIARGQKRMLRIQTYPRTRAISMWFAPLAYAQYASCLANKTQRARRSSSTATTVDISLARTHLARGSFLTIFSTRLVTPTARDWVRHLGDHTQSLRCDKPFLFSPRAVVTELSGASAAAEHSALGGGPGALASLSWRLGSLRTSTDVIGRGLYSGMDLAVELAARGGDCGLSPHAFATAC